MLRDSLALFRERFAVLQREQRRLLGQVVTLTKQLEDRQGHQVKIQKLNSTLGRLEDKELAGVITQLDLGVLEVLYTQASAQNRARLLEDMTPQAAADFVNRLVQPNNAAPTRATAPPDTVASAPAYGNEPESLNQ